MSLEEKVKDALENIRPSLQADGGDLEFVQLDGENRVHIKLVGACGGCPMATMHLKHGVERFLKDSVPEVSEVIQTV